MDDLTDFLHRMGMPAWAVAFIASAYIVFDKLKPWSKRGKSEREILSSDEMTFRKALMDRLADVEGRLETCMKGHAACQAANARLEERLTQIVNAAAAAGIELAIKLSPVAPMPPLKQLVKDSNERERL